MLPALTDPQSYPADIWDYLSDMPYMPSRKEREALLKDAESDPARAKRVRLWDYFFRIRPEDVGKPQRREIADLEKKVSEARLHVGEQLQKLEVERARLISERERLLAEAQKFLGQQIPRLEAERGMLTNEREKLIADTQRQFNEQIQKLESEAAAIKSELARADKEREQQEMGAERVAIAQLEKGSKGKRTRGTVATLLGVPMLILACLALARGFSIDTGDGANTASGVIWLLLCGGIGLPILLFGLWQLAGSRRPSAEKIQQARNVQIGLIRQRFSQYTRQPTQNLQQITARMDKMRADFTAANTPAQKRIDQLAANIEQLNAKLGGVQSQVNSGLAPQQKQIQQIDESLKQIPARMQAAKTDFESSSPPYLQRIQLLKTSINDLIAQIPAPVSDEQINTWLMEDITSLAEVATSRSGLRDRLIPVLNASNPFCIRGPGELQNKELIPMPYRDKNSDRVKHLRARQFVIMPDGSFADFYGVYNFEFILVAEDVLATYGTFYDFISGKQSGEHTTGQHYADVAMIRTQKSYREVETNNNETITMENVPSLSLSLFSGDKIDVTFPDADYFKQIEAPGFSSHTWRFDPATAAENAIKIVREKVDIAKRKI